MKPLDPVERAAVECALGRLFQMGSRPFQPSDLADYEMCRRIVMDVLGAAPIYTPGPNYAHDRLKGAQGD